MTKSKHFAPPSWRASFRPGSLRQDPRSPDEVLRVADVRVAFGGVVALNDLSLSILSGECCGLVGPNGAGKTTLLDVLSGLRQVSSGSVFFEGEDVTLRSSTWLARRGLRRTFQRQQPFSQLSVRENVLVALEWPDGILAVLGDMVSWPTRTRKVRERLSQVEAALARCGLEKVASVQAGHLTIGQIRQMEVARAIVDNPRVLLLDEPTSGLAARETETLGQLITQLPTEQGCTVVLVEHDVDFVMSVCSRVVVMDQGETLADGLPAEVRQDPKVIAAYLGDDHAS